MTGQEIHMVSAETQNADNRDNRARKDRHAAARFRSALDSERRSAALYRGLAAGSTANIFSPGRRGFSA